MWIAIASTAFILVMYLTLFRKQEDPEAELIKQGLYPYNFTDAGKYVSGLRDIATEVDDVFLYPQKKVIKLFWHNKVTRQKEFLEDIDTDNIKGMLREEEEGKYRVILQWEDADFKRNIIFEFEGKTAVKRAATLYKHLKQVADAEAEEDGLQEQILEYLRNGNKLKAVALYKQVKGVGLIEAKAHIDSQKV